MHETVASVLSEAAGVPRRELDRIGDLIEGGMLDSLRLIDAYFAIEAKMEISLAAMGIEQDDFRSLSRLTAKIDRKLRVMRSDVSAG